MLSDVQHVPAGPQVIPDHTLLMHFSTFLEPSTRCVPPAADDQKDRPKPPPSPRAARLLPVLLLRPSGRPGMFHRFASSLFGDDGNEPSQGSQSGDDKQAGEEDEEDWILVNYLGKPHAQLKTFGRTGQRFAFTCNWQDNQFSTFNDGFELKSWV